MRDECSKHKLSSHMLDHNEQYKLANFITALQSLGYFLYPYIHLKCFLNQYIDQK